MGFFIFLAFCIAVFLVFYVKVYRKFDYSAKIVCKAIMIYLGLGATILSIMITVSFVSDIAEEEQDKQLPSRLRSIEYTAARNEYGWLSDYMEIDMDYEEEFECYWERALMHEVMLRYRIFTAAAESGLGEEYDREAETYLQMMRKYCEQPLYTQNIPYGEYFMELAGY